MLHPSVTIKEVSPSIGLGLFTTAHIPQGTVLWAQDALDKIWLPSETKALPRHEADTLEKYAYKNPDGNYILCWGLAIYTNHSCDATMMSFTLGIDIATRDLPPGTELTSEYSYFNLDSAFECGCGRPGCRGTIYPDDVLYYGPQWDRKIATAGAHIPNVPQALSQYLPTQPLVQTTHLEHLSAETKRRAGSWGRTATR